MLLFVEYVPYLAFVAAGLLLAYVGLEWYLRRGKLALDTALPLNVGDSGRGLAGPARALSKRMEPSAPNLPDAASAKSEPEQESATVVVKLEAKLESEEPQPEEATEQGQSEKLIPARRDPSVRVFDTAVAAVDGLETTAVAGSERVKPAGN